MTLPNYSGSTPSISGTQGKISTMAGDDQDTVVAHLKAQNGLSGAGGAPNWWAQLQSFPNTLWNVINGFGAVIAGIGGTIATDISDTILTLSHAVNTVTTGLTDIITGVGGTIATDVSNTIVTIRNLANAVGSDLDATIKNFYNTWFGGSASSGQPADIITTVQAIKIAVENGYTLETFPTSTNGWVIPTGITELNGVCINAGNNGASGSGSGSGGAGGQGGSYVVEPIDLSSYTLGSSTLNFTVGAPGSGSGASGGTSEITDSSGVVLVSGTAGLGGIPTVLGWGTSSGSGGAGGSGGNATNSPSATSGANGAPSAVAVGGTGGTGHTATGVGSVAGGTGTVGGDGTTNTAPLCAGAGGGGGGGAGTNTGSSLMSANGGNGANGGYPGGGGGGGGGSVSTYNNNPGGYGYGGNGFTAVLYK